MIPLYVIDYLSMHLRICTYVPLINSSFFALLTGAHTFNVSYISQNNRIPLLQQLVQQQMSGGAISGGASRSV